MHDFNFVEVIISFSEDVYSVNEGAPEDVIVVISAPTDSFELTLTAMVNVSLPSYENVVENQDFTTDAKTYRIPATAVSGTQYSIPMRDFVIDDDAIETSEEVFTLEACYFGSKCFNTLITIEDDDSEYQSLRLSQSYKTYMLIFL